MGLTEILIMDDVPLPPQMPPTSHTTIRELAKACGVSPATVSLALRDSTQISKTTRARVKRIAEELNYRQNPFVSAFMAHQRSTRRAGKLTSTLAFVTDVPHQSFQDESWWSNFLQGATRRAGQLGYTLDCFFLKDQKLSRKRLSQILKARGIPGVLLCGFYSSNPLDYVDVETHPSVIIGHNPTQSVLNGAENDHVMMMHRLFDELERRNYKRIGMALKFADQKHTDYHYKLSYAHQQMRLPPSDRIPIFNLTDIERKDFVRWLSAYKPDVIITKYDMVRKWLEELDVSVPADLGYVGLDLDQNDARTSGIFFDDERIAGVAIDQLTAAIYRNETGVPEVPQLVSILGRWKDGETLHPPREDEAGGMLLSIHSLTGSKS